MSYGNEIQFNEKWANYIKSTFEHKYNIAEGAVRSGKTVFNCLAFALHIEKYTSEKELLFLAAGVNEAQAKALIGECNGFGLAYYFDKNAEYKKYKNADALKITIYKNKKKLIRWVIFTGGAKADSFKSIRGLSIESCIMSEFNLLHPDFLSECSRRMVAAIDPKWFADLNPTNEGNFIYKDYIDNPRLDLNYLHATLIDNPALSEKRINDIIGEYDPDSVLYKAMILGQRINIEGQIYNLREYNILEDVNVRDYIEYITVADPGENMSGTSFILAGLYYNNSERQYELHILREYWHRNADYKGGHNIKLPKDYAEDYVKFIQECADYMGKWPRVCLLDEDITFYRELLLVNKKVPSSLFKYVAKEEINERIKTGINLLYRGRLRFRSKCTTTISHFKNAVYDAEKVQKGKYERMDKPEISNIDAVDATEYAFTYYIKYLSK